MMTHPDIVKVHEKFRENATNHNLIELLRVCTSHKECSIPIVLYKDIMNSPFIHDEHVLYELAKNLLLSETSSSDLLEVCSTLLDFPNIKEDIRKNVLKYYYIASSRNIDRYTYYPETTIPRLKQHRDDQLFGVTLVMTTCKRLPLFKDTINSFLNCCSDLHLITDWVIIDDNSSEEDRREMKRLYPFFRYILKDKSDIGHPRSMNIMKKNLKTPYLFLLEDDWKFFVKNDYITRCLKVLSENIFYGQCLINKNYVETARDVRCIGGKYKVTRGGLPYYLHHHEKDMNTFFKTMGESGPNCAYWPHFSFRPGLTRRDVFNYLGEFSETHHHFERDYGERYMRLKLVTAFLEGISCIHTGRLTSEIHDKTKMNAYTLNNQSQFTKKPDKPPVTVSKDTETLRDLGVKILVINLAQRVKRREEMTRKLEEVIPGCFQEGVVTFFDAVKGDELTLNKYTEKYFSVGDYNYREGIVGCSLSHLLIMSQMKVNDRIVILEDDIELNKNFSHSIISCINNKIPFVYLGFHSKAHVKFRDIEDTTIIRFDDTTDIMEKSYGGTIGYYIDYYGAQNFLAFVNKVKMTNAIDTMQQKSADVSEIWYVNPPVVTSPCHITNMNVDSDIQRNYKRLREPIHNYDFLENVNIDGNDIYKCLTYHTTKSEHNYQLDTTFRHSLDTILKYKRLGRRLDTILMIGNYNSGGEISAVIKELRVQLLTYVDTKSSAQFDEKVHFARTLFGTLERIYSPTNIDRPVNPIRVVSCNLGDVTKTYDIVYASLKKCPEHLLESFVDAINNYTNDNGMFIIESNAPLHTHLKKYQNFNITTQTNSYVCILK